MNIKTIVKDLARIRFGKKIVFCSGTFDILHEGHIDFLRKASKKGDILIVGINSDACVSLRKGKDRPIMNQKSREKIVSVIRYVDFTFIKENFLKKEDIISLLKPDVVIFNSDSYKSENHKKRHLLLKKTFPEIRFYSFFRIKKNEHHSTTTIIEKIKKG